MGELLISLQNNTLSRAELSDELGVAKNVHYGDVLIKFGNVLDVSKERFPMISDEGVLEKYKESFLKNGDVIVADTAEDSTVGKCSEISGLNDEVVLSGLHTIPYRPIEKFAFGYLGYYLNSNAYHDQLIPLMQGIKVTSISKSAMKDTEIVYPKSVEEQGKVAEYFRNLDRLITLHQQKLTLLTKLKKAMLEKMFPKKGSVIPEIRFNGFANAWEQRKLGELYQRNTERNENFIRYDKTISVATMSYKDDGNGASESSLSTYKVLRVGDIAFEGHTNKQFRFGRFVVNDIGTGIMSPRFSALRPLNEMPVNFWKQYIHSESVIRGILVKSTKAGTMMNELVIPEFLNQTIMVPSENEQAVIGQYFASLENLITLHQRKIDKLKNLKKAMLDQMFI